MYVEWGNDNLSQKVTVTIIYINHRPVFYLKHDVSETGLSPLSGGTYSVRHNR
jgi:hypothetical protein